jgi:hypothetical protein
MPLRRLFPVYLLCRRVVPIATGALLVAGLSLLGPPLVAAAPAPSTTAVLDVTASRPLSTVGQGVRLIFQGPAGLWDSQGLEGASFRGSDTAAGEGRTAVTEPASVADPASAASTVTIRLYGPLLRDAVGRPASQLPEPEIFRTASATAPKGFTPSPGYAAASTVIPLEALARPGAYLASVSVDIPPGGTVAYGSTWLGRVAADCQTTDVACVWPLAPGVHRDVAGVFFDAVFEALLDDRTAGSLWGVASLRERFPDWRFTMAVEPILLTQLAELADGYFCKDESGGLTQIGADDRTAQNAAGFLAALKELASVDGIDVVTAPYAGASPRVLAGCGWDDGIGQVQLGKKALQQALDLSSPVNGAFSPDLDISTASLSSFSRASVDHVLVSEDVADDLAEPVTAGGVTARARDTVGERVTLVFADDWLRSVTEPPWDPGLVCAALAARVTALPGSPVVLTPSSVATLPPVSYLDSLGRALANVGWLRTCTLAEIVRAHSPDSRPVFLNRAAGEMPGYIETSLLDSVAKARTAVEALEEAAGSSQPPLTEALLLLYTAESAGWSRPGTSLDVTNVGLAYARRALTTACEELGKVQVLGADGLLVTGRDGVISLRLQNKADYEMTIRLRLQGTGLRFADGADLPVNLAPGTTVVPLRVSPALGSHRLEVDLMAGEVAVGSWSGKVRFLIVSTFLPWVLVGVVLVALGTVFLLLRRSRRVRGRRQDTTQQQEPL